MGFPSPAKDYAEAALTITSLCGYDGNCRTVETSAGYAIINVANKPHPGDTVLISYCGRTEFAIVQGKALITPEGETLAGDSAWCCDPLPEPRRQSAARPDTSHVTSARA